MAALRTVGGFLVASRARSSTNTAGGRDTTREATGNGREATGNGQSDVWTELRVELARARRFGRPFALVRVDGMRGRRLKAGLRSIDRHWVADRATYVLLPESDREGAASLVARLRREAADVLEGCSVAIAAFPDDGLTSGALLERLEPKRAAVPEREIAMPSLADSPLVHA